MFKRFIFLSFFFVACIAQAQAADLAGVVSFATGDAWLKRGDATQAIAADTKVFSGDEVVTQASGRVKLDMQDGSVVYIGSRSRIAVADYVMNEQKLQRGYFDLAWGKARFMVKKLTEAKADFSVKTKTATIGVRGTQFSVSYPVPDVPETGDIAALNKVEIPQVPTTVMLFEGAVVARTVKGIEHAIKPGDLARIQASGRVFARPIRKPDVDKLEIEEIIPVAGADLELQDRKISEVDAPEIKKPEVETLEAKKVEFDEPEVKEPEVRSPEIKVPEVEAPEVKTPVIKTPEIKEPEVRAPEVKVPEIKVPEVEVPEVKVPEVKVPEVKVPEVKVPEVKVPEVKVPDFDMPSIDVPDFDESDFRKHHRKHHD